MGESLPRTETFGSPVTDVSYEHRPAAYAVIRDSKGRVAAVHTRLGYFLPGGGMEADETPEATVIREIREELACSARITGKLGEALQYFSVDGRFYRTPATFFFAQLTGEPQGESEYALCWLEPKEFEQAFFHESHAWAAAQL
jgi:8-oxo-dGTP diphosphatase